MTSSLHQQVRRTIRRHDLCPSGSRVIVGLSGGSDSVALALLLRDLAEHGGFIVAGLAHLNHQIRPTAARDEAFCRDLAARLGVCLVADTVDVPAYAASSRLSLEDAARRVRYEFLERVADTLAADRVAVGHTQDDQAETFLLKLMRGAGPAGLGGIYPRRGAVVRPLLEVSRGDLRAYLRGLGESWVEDETNRDLDNPRNLVRHVVLRELDRAAAGETRPAIARAAMLIREDGQFLDDLGRQRFLALAADTEGGLEFDTGQLLAEPVPILRRVLLRGLRQVAGSREVGLDHIEAVLGLLRGGTSGGIDLPGSRVELRGRKAVLLQRGASK